jgi:putative ABC transport system permease protein
MSLGSSITVALEALARNRLQTVLTMTGITIGVATVLTMVAVGNGARSAIDQQIRAAGMNLIVVRAGNYKVKTEEDFGGVVDHQAASRELAGTPTEGTEVAATERTEVAETEGTERTVLHRETEQRRRTASPCTQSNLRFSAPLCYTVASVDSVPDFSVGSAPVSSVTSVPVSAVASVVSVAFHPEDDPMEKHDHPTASQRLGDTAAGLGAAATLTADDAAAIRSIRGVQHVSEGVHENVRVATDAKRWFTRLHGSDVELPEIRRAWTFTAGRFFTVREQRSASQVAVLGSVAAQRLFGTINPVGRIVSLWKQPFDVIGVVSSGSWMVAAAPGDDQFDAVYVPFTTVHRLLNLSKLNDITVTAASTGDVTRVAREITELLRQRHRVGFKDPDDFTVTTQARRALASGGLRPDVARAVVGNVAGLEQVTLEQLGRTLDRAMRTMAALLGSIAAVSLIVGGIGIMNVMLLSVTERTQEIGLRRAVGARSGDVLRQFLVEAMVLSAIGGLAGIVLGAAASGILARVLHWSTALSAAAVLASFASAAAIGLFFGYYPAREASRVDPIESLRYE